MRIRVGRRIGRRSWISTTVDTNKLTATAPRQPRGRTFEHEEKGMRKACRRYHGRKIRHTSQFDLGLCEARLSGGEDAATLYVHGYNDEMTRTLAARSQPRIDAALARAAEHRASLERVHAENVARFGPEWDRDNPLPPAPVLNPRRR